ncbi:NAD(P)-binding protein [Xylaria arbuscula]|nr:NAD(P)-binding protein [Xylaria arbuscula]
MAIIAVAGGTASVGRAIVEAIIAAGKHEVKILSRNPNPELESSIGAKIIPVDYMNVEGTTKILEDNNIHTVISTMTFRPQEGTIPELQLVQAAEASKTTKRYVFNNWGAPIEDGDELKMSIQSFKVAALKALKQTQTLEYTSFYLGFFLDYWGMPAVHSYLRPGLMVVDIANAAATIPGDGTTPVAFTHTNDVAKYVAAVLDLEKWEPEYNLSADKVNWKQFVALAEEARGVKFDVAYDSVEKLEAGDVTPLPFHVAAGLYAAGSPYPKITIATYLFLESGKFDIKKGKSAKEVFPDIKPMTVKELLFKAWNKA